jgi:hypothetical protein
VSATGAGRNVGHVEFDMDEKNGLTGVSESAGINRLETKNERVLQRKPSQ